MNLPSMSAATPDFVPFMSTLAPITGSPLESVTVPLTSMFCANAALTEKVRVTIAINAQRKKRLVDL